MAKVIVGTEDFTEGALYRPDGSDNGNEFSSIVTEFMERMAVHAHAGDSSTVISLPPNVVDPWLAPLFIADGTDRYQTVLTFTQGTTERKNPVFYYKLQSDPDTQEYWKRFYPSYDVDASNPKIVTLRKLIANDISIKAVS